MEESECKSCGCYSSSSKTCHNYVIEINGHAFVHAVKISDIKECRHAHIKKLNFEKALITLYSGKMVTNTLHNQQTVYCKIDDTIHCANVLKDGTLTKFVECPLSKIDYISRMINQTFEEYTIPVKTTKTEDSKKEPVKENTSRQYLSFWEAIQKLDENHSLKFKREAWNKNFYQEKTHCISCDKWSNTILCYADPYSKLLGYHYFDYIPSFEDILSKDWYELK